MNPEVINYIKEAKEHGLSEQDIKQTLFNAGWEADVVKSSFEHYLAMEHQPLENKDEDIQLPAKTKTKTEEADAAPVTDQQVETQVSLVAVSNEQLNANTTPSGNKKRVLITVGIVAILAILGVGGFFVYTYGYFTPEKIWTKYASSGQSDIYQNNFTFSYTDKAPGSSTTTEVKDIKLSVNGKFYVDDSQNNNPKSSSEFSYEFGSGNSSVKTGLKYTLLSNVLYVNVSENPVLNSIFSTADRKIDWVKLDLNELQKQASSSVDTAKLKSDLENIFSQAKLIKMDKYLGRDKIDGVMALHFSNLLDKEALKSTASAMVEKLAEESKAQGETVEDSGVQTVKIAVNALIDKLQVQQFETWISPKDLKLRRFVFASNAPSFLSVTNAVTTSALSGSQGKSNDAKRLADAGQMALALGLYFKDHNRYPEADSDGAPKGLAPVYIAKIPTAPTPPDGNCTDYYNTYWYTVDKNGQNYSFTFCLGAPTGGYKSGIAKLSAAGIEGAVPCPGDISKCAASDEVVKARTSGSVQQPQQTPAIDEIQALIDKISFSAQLKIDSTYFGFGEKQNLTAPENPYDLMQIFNKLPLPSSAPSSTLGKLSIPAKTVGDLNFAMPAVLTKIIK